MINKRGRETERAAREEGDPNKKQGRKKGEKDPIFVSMSAAKVQVTEVWASNEEEELSLLRALCRDFPIAAVATSLELASDLRAPPFPCTLDDSYEAVRAAVDGVLSAQVGLALFNQDGELPPGGRVWRFHLGEGEAEGKADPYRVCGALAACRYAAMLKGIWVTWDGAHDMAYLVRYLNGGSLPGLRGRFLHLCNAFFPQLYDLKVLAEWTPVEAMEPPAAGVSRNGAFGRFLSLARKWSFKGLMLGYNSFLSGLGAADEHELVFYKEEAFKQEESRRRLKDMLRKKGRSEEYIRKLNLC